MMQQKLAMAVPPTNPPNAEGGTGNDPPLVEDLLQIEGIKIEDIDRLKKNGIYTIGAIINYPPRHLISIGISETAVKLILNAASKITNVGFICASHFHSARSDILKISTGSKELNRILGGGVETGQITCISGESRSGKTIFLHTLCVITQLCPDLGGLDGKALYFDTEGKLRTQTFINIGQRFAVDEVDVLENIICFRVYNSDRLMDKLKDAAGLLADSRFGILVVDSIMSVLRTEYQGRGELPERQAKLAKILQMLRVLAVEFGVAVILTNPVYATVDGQTNGKLLEVAGGNVLKHGVSEMIEFGVGQNYTRTATLIKSPKLPEATCLFQITGSGIHDVI